MEKYKTIIEKCFWRQWESAFSLLKGHTSHHWWNFGWNKYTLGCNKQEIRSEQQWLRRIQSAKEKKNCIEIGEPIYFNRVTWKKTAAKTWCVKKFSNLAI